MDTPLSIVVYGLLALGAMWLFISFAGALPIFKLANVEIEKLDPPEARPWLQKVITSGMVDSQWLGEMNFKPLGVYRLPKQMGNPHFVVWQVPGERSYICAYVVMQNRVEIDLKTVFDEGGLTTGTTKDGLTLPGRPRQWMQAFPIRNVAALWKEHIDAVVFLRDNIGQRPSKQAISFEEEFISSVRGHTAYLRTIPFWFLRIPYWYFVRRPRLFNRTIREQYERFGSSIASM